jgi:hypothetical protein
VTHAVQQQLLATGTHFEPSGADMKGPAVEVCIRAARGGGRA